MKKYIVNSLDEYIKVISEISQNESEMWFRGQTNAAWYLNPSLLRQKIETEFIFENENTIHECTKEVMYKIPNFEYALNEFKRKAIGLIKTVPQNDFEWMFLMQHYGVPTTLLDWSTNALVGLYFAIPDTFYSNKYTFSEIEIERFNEEFMEKGYSKGGSSIYIINPVKINKKAHGIKSIIDVQRNYKKWEKYIFSNRESASKFPVCIQAPHIDKRIRSQSGMFTLHSSKIEALNWYELLKVETYKIFIPQAKWFNFKNDMKMLGITTSYIFPDLQGVAKEIKEDIFEKFWREKI